MRTEHWTGQKRDGFFSSWRAELLNQIDVFSFVLPSPELAQSSGRMDVIAYFLPVVFIDLHFERANCWSPLPSSPQRRELCSTIKAGCLRCKALPFLS